MCGIAGLISTNASQRIATMTRAVAHRGRDDEGVWSAQVGDAGQTVALGHRRLSIIDTSAAGHQPFVSADGRYALTYNGEIYNYCEVRDELTARGHVFHTDCDTEVLLVAFQEWGAACLPRLNGMFAFGVWDNVTRTLTLARDRLGIKPLYYFNVPEGKATGGAAFAFGSEIKAILAAGVVAPELNVEALNQTLTFLWTPEPHTLFAGVQHLPAGHLLSVRVEADGSLDARVSEWWDATFDEIEEGRSDGWWQENLLEKLERVVRMEMVADVPLGAFLSGGVDSSTVVALMHKINRGAQSVSTYTVGFPPEDLRYDIIPDDAVWARQVGALLNTDYHEITLRPDVADLLPLMVRHMEQPVIDMAIPSYLVAKSARETLTVLLSGMGGDEVFAGYPRQLAMRFASLLDPVPRAVRRPLMSMIESSLPGGLPGRLTAPLRNAKKFARSAALNFEERYLGYGTYFTDEMRARLFSSDLRNATAGMDAYSEHRRHFARVKNAAPLNRMLYVDMKTFLPSLNLLYTDKTAMAATLEVRVPFLNRELVEFAARMPPSLKLRGLKRKFILKRAAETLLPHDVVWRKKAGFGAPVRAWLRGALQPLVNDLLSEETVKRRGLFEPREVRRVVEANASGREDNNLQVLQLLTLEMWHREFIDAN